MIYCISISFNWKEIHIDAHRTVTSAGAGAKSRPGEWGDRRFGRNHVPGVGCRGDWSMKWGADNMI